MDSSPCLFLRHVLSNAPAMRFVKTFCRCWKRQLQAEERRCMGQGFAKLRSVCSSPAIWHLSRWQAGFCRYCLQCSSLKSIVATTGDPSVSGALLPTKLCHRAGEVVNVCTESPRQHKVTRMRSCRFNALLFLRFLYEGLSKSLSAGPYAGQSMGQRERTPSGKRGSLSLMHGKDMLQATSSMILNV